MIISPPFIPAPVAGESDEAFLARAMVGGIPGDGGYPLSFDLNWHGGIHLIAPQDGQSALPVRAISDGTLAYFRNPTPESNDPNHPLLYRDKWTDDGCVVIKHETEIGEGAKAKVVFYSIYMHLSKINLASPQKGKVIYRKDSIGDAGSIYGEKGRIHFEVIADQSQIANLTGRDIRDLNYQTASGRVDSCWGDMYFFIPPEVRIYQSAPNDRVSSQNGSSIIYQCPAMSAGPAPIQEGGSPSSSPSSTPLVDGYDWAVALELQDGFFVRMSYAKGQCRLTSFTRSGVEIGVQEEEIDYEYNLYKKSKTLYPQSPSAGYELLRFGRVLGNDQLQPSEAAHWRAIKFPGKAGETSKVGWVDFNHLTVTKFSDADFPHWMGWRLIDDDTDSDSHCQSPFIRGLLNLDAAKVVSDSTDAVSIASSPAYAALSTEEQLKLSERYVAERDINKIKLQKPDVQEKINNLICKFPSEWSKNDFDVRYGWLLKVCDDGPMPQDKYQKLKAHQQALGFWEEAGIPSIENKHWHFPPKAFISFFRKCSWLSLDEIAYTVPKYHFYDHTGSTWAVHIGGENSPYQISHARAKTRLSNYYLELNRTAMRYNITSTLRQSHFLAQTMLETDRWQVVHEYGSGHPNPHIPKAQYYTVFFGRGIMQLTWAGNYESYGEFRTLRSLPAPGNNHYHDDRITATSTHYWEDPVHTQNGQAVVTGIPKRWSPRYDPYLVESVPYNACDSGGFYWVSRVVKIAGGLININRTCDKGITPEIVGAVSVSVNGGGNGYHERQAYAKYIYRYLSDSLEATVSETFTTPRQTVIMNYSMSKPS
ncbi:M23 family metallopeptidase [Pseudomonas sp. P9_31]|uniref:M23 family metallopeptidase n=1 Tax=Pseudomonas sp. P9_31 TaxID=3043448 RepID=UPI002A35A9AF|nr:M23 family metallopeptidase [Pseudomonas sp. P9_31]WPN57837.1 M23 family metallopeptidase [Pseudomonas sp. P9_31]